jgi:Omp85 superfamily domain
MHHVIDYGRALRPLRRCSPLPTILCVALLTTPSWSASPGADPPPTPAPGPIAPPPAAPDQGLWKWFNPATAPFIPVPDIDVDPNSGTTFGVIPTWVQTDENHEIRRIIAPDVNYNPYFGYGVHGRVYGFTSGDEQWSVIAGIKERLEREFDAEYQGGRTREQLWSRNFSLIYDRSGTPRFYGIGNESPAIAETNYTNQQERAQMQIGLNLSHVWQLLYTGRLQVVDVLPGTLARIATLESRFGRILGVGTNKELLNRLSIVYDTRDDLTVPSHGMQLIAYGGLASRSGLLNNSMYSEAGGDGRVFWPMAQDTILAAHMALRYLPTSHRVPFWALSSIGGGDSEVGGAQPLRGFGSGRFYDRDSFSASVELRRKVLSVDAVSTKLDVEVTPFIDVGRVFGRPGTFPLDRLHHVYGVGFRGVARPFVVGYLDIGYGSEGVAAFTGINYPF